MAVTYDPRHPDYFNETDVRDELDRVFDLCHGCRLCFNLCPSFGTLFRTIDDAHDGDAKALTAAEQDQVVDECYQCKLCYVKCPYVPPHEWELDFPRLVMRANATRQHNHQTSVKERVTDQALARTDMIGKVSVALAPLANRVIGHPGSLARKVMEKTAGMASERVLPPYARQRFTTWFRKRAAADSVRRPGDQQGEVAVFPTCFIEYMAPDIGKDVVRVYERNRVSCHVPSGASCCGAPWLHSGHVDKFIEVAEANIEALVPHVRAGREVVVAQPTCAYVLRFDYPRYVQSADAELVAAHSVDPAEYLMRLHRHESTELDTDFPGVQSGAVPDKVTYHAACHLRALNMGLKSRDLLKVAGITADVVQQCSGIDGTWGYRAENYDMARRVAKKMKADIDKAGNDVVCGDCHLANGSIIQETGITPSHPIQLLAHAYAIPEDAP